MSSKLDRSAETIVVYCPDCRDFAALFLVTQEFYAHELAVAHEARVHPGCSNAAAARSYFRSKAA